MGHIDFKPCVLGLVVVAIGGLIPLEARAACHRCGATPARCCQSAAYDKSRVHSGSAPAPVATCCVAATHACGACHHHRCVGRASASLRVDVCCHTAKVYVEGRGTATGGLVRHYAMEGLVPGKNCCIQIKVVCGENEQLAKRVCVRDGGAHVVCANAHTAARDAGPAAPTHGTNHDKSAHLEALINKILDERAKTSKEGAMPSGAAEESPPRPAPAPANPNDGSSAEGEDK
jgi:hypothetical protein